MKGIDISKRAISIAQAAKKETQLKNVTFANEVLSKGKAQYDLAVCSEVIEHIADENDFLKKIHSNLKKGGKLLLTTPSKENVLYKMNYYQKFDKEVGHLRRYTRASLIKLLKTNHFEIIALKEVEGPLRNILFTSKLGFLIKFIKGPLVPLFHLIDGVLAKLLGASDLQVLVKKV